MLYKRPVMEFEAYPIRKEGRVMPRHVMWAGKARGDLWITEEYDAELKRHTRVAMLKGPGGKVLLPPLVDAAVVSAKPDWWTMTGWERHTEDFGCGPKAFVQSWILIPADAADPLPKKAPQRPSEGP